MFFYMGIAGNQLGGVQLGSMSLAILKAQGDAFITFMSSDSQRSSRIQATREQYNGPSHGAPKHTHTKSAPTVFFK
jgi:hypothetical protein